MDMDKVVCYCMGVTNGAVKAAVDAGANTLEDVQAETGASTVCGACMENVQRLVDFFVKERDGKSQREWGVSRKRRSLIYLWADVQKGGDSEAL